MLATWPAVSLLKRKVHVIKIPVYQKPPPPTPDKLKGPGRQYKKALSQEKPKESVQRSTHNPTIWGEPPQAWTPTSWKKKESSVLQKGHILLKSSDLETHPGMGSWEGPILRVHVQVR